MRKTYKMSFLHKEKSYQSHFWEKIKKKKKKWFKVASAEKLLFLIQH